jgi:ribosomal protein S18 acetylase RimI-like enzyme
MSEYTIENTEPEEVEHICQLFDNAIKWQKDNGHIAWKGFDKEELAREIADKQQYKVVKAGKITSVFSVCYNDPIVWQERNEDKAIYLHRIVVDFNLKEPRQFEKILKWAIKEASIQGIKYIRMDTWHNNAQIVEYYSTYGFKIVGYVSTPDTANMPITYRNLHLVLLEIAL